MNDSWMSRRKKNEKHCPPIFQCASRVRTWEALLKGRSSKGHPLLRNTLQLQTYLQHYDFHLMPFLFCANFTPETL
jgi:hypothetical protein